MIIKKEKDEALTDLEVLIRYAQENGELSRLLALLNAHHKRIRCKTGSGREQMVDVSAVHYIESVDKKTFVYLAKDVLQTEHRLYQLRALLEKLGFVQISKSCLLNMAVLESIRPLVNSRMEALLTNGERVFVSRKYLGEVRRALQEESA